MSDADLLKEAQEAFAECEERERENRAEAEADIRFARLEEQWPPEVKAQREREGRPCLTVNKLPSFIRQVVNDARQNKPQIKVQPQDGDADVETAEVISGLIRNIETTSDADVAYDTAVESAVSGGFGYFRVNLKYACDDNWDQDITVDQVPNPFSVYGDPYATEADSSGWNVAFVADRMSKAAYKRDYRGGQEVDWSFADFPDHWAEGDDITVAEWWKRERIRKKIVLLSDGSVIDLKQMEANKEAYYAAGIEVRGAPREVMSYKVTQRIINGVEVLETVDWAGKYIPIIPVYGEEINLKGKRHFRSLIRSAKDPQRMVNYWRSTATELVALAPKAPFIGRKGAFETDAAKWATANTQTHAYIEYDGPDAPERQPFAGVPAGALQEALSASDDIKSILGLYDASLGARSNETSGRAINARKLEGDTGTFHFQDNLNRGVRHGGRVVLDLIPHIYTADRIIRTIGHDGQASTIPLGQETPYQVKGPDGQRRDVMKVFDLTAGKYDLTVSAGPSYTTRREEVADQMIQFVQAFPAAAPVMGDKLAKNLDWPEAEEIGERLKALMPPQAQGGIPPQVAEQMQQMHEEGQALAQENQQLKTDNTAAIIKAQADVTKAQTDARKADTDAYKAETERMLALHTIQQPSEPPQGLNEAA